MTIIHTLSGWQNINTTPAALAADALACEQAHADRLVRTLGLYCETRWQAGEYAGLWDLPLPDDGPGDDDPDGGPQPEPDEARSVDLGALRACVDASVTVGALAALVSSGVYLHRRGLLVDDPARYDWADVQALGRLVA
jgi:hypothetical protein